MAKDKPPLPSTPIAAVAPLPFILTDHQQQILKDALGLEPGHGKLIFRATWDQVSGATLGAGVSHKVNEHFVIGAEAGWNKQAGAQAVVLGEIVWEPEP